MTNLNELALKVSISEGLKKNTNIAQIKEILRLTLRELKQMSMDEVATLLKRIK